jgi:hypothetical protein
MMTTAANLTLAAHVLWVALVALGTLWTRGRLVWSTLHILALISGIAAQLGAFICPLTIAEHYFRSQAGMPHYQGRFLVHYVNALLSTQFPAWPITAVGVAICLFNLGIYGRRYRNFQLQRQAST